MWCLNRRFKLAIAAFGNENRVMKMASNLLNTWTLGIANTDRQNGTAIENCIHFLLLWLTGLKLQSNTF